MKPDYDADYNPIDQFSLVRKARAGAWSKNYGHSFEATQVAAEDTLMFVVRHAHSYKGITRANLLGSLYEIVTVDSEPIPGPRAYDLLTLREVKPNG